MSLISDALKRARQEAARQDSLRQGLPYAVGMADPPVRRAPWISLLAGLGAGCILAAAVFALAFFAGWGPFHKPAVETRTAEVPATAPVPVTPQPPVTEPAALPVAPPQAQERPAAPITPPPVSVAAPTPAPKPEVPREPERRPAPQAVAPPPVVRRPAPEPTPATPTSSAPIAEVERSAPAPVPAAPPQAPPAGDLGGLVEGQVYSGEVPVPGGGSVKLNGIVFSQDHPIAVLDGRVMGPGESVQGFTVVAIESGRVKLQGHGTTVYLSPK
jgi:hypothetical protein